MIEGVACPEASTHSSVQGDFIPTMSLGIPGDAVMALILGALMIQGIVPGPQLISEHPDIFWGLIACFWIGNIILVILNVPMIGLWVKLLTIPYNYLYPSALFFVCIGVYSTNNDMFQVGETIIIGIVGYLLLLLDFHPAPILLGFVLGPRFEENFRRAMLISRGDVWVFVKHPISAVFIGAVRAADRRADLRAPARAEGAARPNSALPADHHKTAEASRVRRFALDEFRGSARAAASASGRSTKSRRHSTSPAFRRVVALDHRVAGQVEVFARVLVGHAIVAAADMAAGAAQPQMRRKASRS